MDGYSINKTEFGERIKNAREELKMTQTQLAKLLNTSQTTVAKYEHGEQIPRADVLAAISKVTRKSSDWLLFGNKSTIEKGDVAPEKWLSHFIDLLTHPQPVNGYIPTLVEDEDYKKGYSNSIFLNNHVGCKDNLSQWEFLDKEAATVSFYGREMAAFFQKLAAIETVKDMLPPAQIQLLEENAIDAGAEIFQPDILPF